jgi:hypothetical protein
MNNKVRHPNEKPLVLSLALLESLAYQLVPLVKKVGGIPEIVQNNKKVCFFLRLNLIERSICLQTICYLQLFQIIKKNLTLDIYNSRTSIIKSHIEYTKNDT